MGHLWWAGFAVADLALAGLAGWGLVWLYRRWCEVAENWTDDND